jgi:hypothetical protein
MAKKSFTEKQTALLDEARRALQQGKKVESLSKEQKDALRREYGYAYGFITSNNELRKLFTRAVREGFTPQAFALELQNTSWYKQRTASQREYDTMLNTPSMRGDLDNTLNQITDQVKRIAADLSGKTLSDEDARAFAEDVARNNLRDWQNTLPDLVGKAFVGDDIFEYGGRAAQTATQIRGFAEEMGVTLDDASLGNYVDRVFAGEQNIEDIQNNFRESAVGYLPQFASRIKAGETVKSIVSPYRDMIASYLEVDANEIGFGMGAGSKSDPLLNKALFGTEGKAMPLYDVQKAIKQDSRWQKTSNAREEYTQLTKNLLRSFGVGI